MDIIQSEMVVASSPEDGQARSDFLTSEQRQLLLRRTPVRTALKIAFALGFIATLLGALWYRSSLPFSASGRIAVCTLCMIGLGLLYAHVAEFQHELLHGHGFRSTALNRCLGFICGLPILNSYSQYRFQHLKHHRFLGTERNTEHFQYPYDGLDNPKRMAAAAFSLNRYKVLLPTMVKAMCGVGLADVDDDAVRRQIRTEHVLYMLLVAATALYSLVAADAFFVIAWLLPALFVAEPIHFFIELPEHFGLEAYQDRDVFRNTRTIEATWLLRWYTNGNNLHTAHHLMAGVPMSRCHELHLIIRNSYQHYEPSYTAFLASVLSGKLRPVQA